MSAPSDIVFYHHAFFQHVGSSPRPPTAPRRQSASQRKLAGFSETHLAELSTDMYDELQRRLHPERFPPGPLASRNDIHWKRNDARKHVGSLPAQRFDDICRDLLEEQERRYPELRSLPTPTADTPQPRTVTRNASITSANSNPSSDVYAFPLSASPRENGQGNDIFDSVEQKSPADSGDHERSQSPSLHIQSVAESKIEPQRTEIVESDDDSDSDDGMYGVYDGDKHHEESEERAEEEEEDPNATPRAHNRDLSETSGRTSYVTTEDMPTEIPIRDHSEARDFQRTSSINEDRGYDDELYDRPRSALQDTTLDGNEAYREHPDTEMLSSRIRDLENENEQHRTRIEHLLRNQADPDLERTLEDQRNVTEKVRQEAAQFLEEMRALTQQHERQVDRADTMDAEAKHWKRRYNKLLAELEASKKQRVKSAIEQPHFTELPPDWYSATGLVSEQHIWHYFGAISALVSFVHSDKGKRGDALEYLHAVVLASRALTQSSNSLIPKAANLLITVVRNFAVSKGLMPLIIVDSACSDLTMAVIEYCSKHKVHPGDAGKQLPLRQLEGNQQANNAQGNAHKKNKSSVSFQFDEKRSRELPKIPSPEKNMAKNELKEEPDLENSAELGALKERADATESQSQSRPPPLQQSQRQSQPQPLQSQPQPQPQPELQSQTPSHSRTRSRPESQGTPDAVTGPSTPTSFRSIESNKFRPVQGPQMPLDSSIQSLQTYLEEQTSGTVDAIGALLAGIKNNVVAGELKPRVGQIQELVSQMIDASNSAIGETRNLLLKERGTLIVDNLKNCLARMGMLLDEELEALRNDAKPNRHLKQRLAGVSFDMAKSTKELVKTVEEATLKEELDGIGRQLH